VFTRDDGAATVATLLGVVIMFKGRTVFAQLLDFVPHKHFEYLVQKSSANRWTKTLPAWSHFVCLAYAQVTRREGLRDLVACLNSHRSRLYHLGVRHRISRSTLADASERRDWHLFESLGQRLIAQALDLHRQAAHPLGLQEPLYAMDSTVIDLCLALFPWAEFRQTKAAVKVHTVIDLRGCIPVFLSITEGRVNDINLLAEISLPAHPRWCLTGGILILQNCTHCRKGTSTLWCAAGTICATGCCSPMRLTTARGCVPMSALR
jgi:hypothetical protein